MKTLGGEADASALKSELGVNYNLYLQVKRIQNMNGEIQARMPYDLDVK
jgi:protease-4